nr:XRE family transcriptional regulator [uncultured Tistrella sp.]
MTTRPKEAARLTILREAAGVSRRELADRLNTSYQQIHRLETGERKLSPDWIRRIARVIGVREEALLSDGPVVDAFLAGAPSGGVSARSATGATLLPVFGRGGRSCEGMLRLDGDAVQYIDRPRSLDRAPAAYAVFVHDTSMEPRYSPGQVVLVNPARPVTPGCYVVARFPGADGVTLGAVRRLVAQAEGVVLTETLNPLVRYRDAEDMVAALHRVVGALDV